MKIDNLELREWGNVKATFSLVVDEGITIYKFKIVNGRNGLFVSIPQEKGSDNKWYPRIGMSRELLDKLSDDALKAYRDAGGSDPAPPSENNPPVF